MFERVGGNCKPIAHQKNAKQAKERISSQDFSEDVAQFVPPSKIIYIDQDNISKEKDKKKPFENVAKVPGIFKTYIIYCNLYTLTEKLYRKYALSVI